MVKYLLTGMAAAAVLAAWSAGQAADLSMTPIYKGRPALGSVSAWALADRWTIYSSIEAAASAPPPAGESKHRNAWSAGTGYIMLTRWSLKGEYGYVNFLDPAESAPPAAGGTTVLAKTNAAASGRAVKVGGNYGF
jgi:hypothetical protein